MHIPRPTVVYLPRSLFEQLSPALNAVAVSIGDPGASIPSVFYKYTDGLRLEFADVDLTQERFSWATFFLKRLLKTRWAVKRFFERSTFFHAEHARLLCAFLATHPEKDLVVHCDYGKSRSLTVARWATECGWEMSKEERFSERKGNLWVRELLELES